MRGIVPSGGHTMGTPRSIREVSKIVTTDIFSRWFPRTRNCARAYEAILVIGVNNLVRLYSGSSRNA
jgi:hypothetical protein